METIKLSDAIKTMEQSVAPDGSENPFDIEFIKFNKTEQKDNGKILSLKNCVKMGLPGNVKKSQRRGLRVLRTGEKKSCHIFLITKFNGKQVKW